MKPNDLMTMGVVNQGLLEILTNNGLQLDALRAKTGYAPLELDNPDLRIPFSVQLRLWELAMEATGDAAFGLNFHSYLHKRNYIHFIVHLIQFTKALGECIRLLCATTPLFSEAERFTIHEKKGGWMVTHSFLCPEYHRSIPEFHAASSVVYSQIFTGKNIVPQLIEFAHPDPGYGEQCAKILQCPVKFGQPHNAMHWDNEHLDLKLTTANPFLLHQLSDLVKERLEKNKRENTFTEQVSRLIIERLPTGKLSAESVAAGLGIDRTTLYRKLNKDADTSFQQLTTNIRKELADSYLKQGMGQTEIAYLLGFSEPSTFAHAFKRWYKMTPGEWRKRSS